MSDMDIASGYETDRGAESQQEPLMAAFHVPSLRAQGQQAGECLAAAPEVWSAELEELRLHPAAEPQQPRKVPVARGGGPEVSGRRLRRGSGADPWVHARAGDDLVQQGAGSSVRELGPGHAARAARSREPQQGTTAPGFQQAQPSFDRHKRHRFLWMWQKEGGGGLNKGTRSACPWQRS